MNGKFIIKQSASGQFYFELTIKGIVLATSQHYFSKVATENAIINVRKYVIDAEVVYKIPSK